MQGERVRYEAVKDLCLETFKRLTGVKPEVFGQLTGVLKQAESDLILAQRPGWS